MRANSGRSTSILLILGNFSVVCGAFAIVGVLPSVRAELGLTGFEAGMLISVYALTYAFASPFLGWAATRFTYRRILVWAALIAGAGAFVASVAGSFPVLLSSRMVAAVGAALFSPTAAALAVARAAPGREGSALSIVALGIPMSQVLGLPLAAWIGDAFGWRAAFLALAGLLLAVGLLLALLVAPSSRPAPMALAAFLRTLSNRVILANVLLTLSISAAVNLLYTFQAQIFAERAGLSAAGLGTALLCLGLGTLAGTWLTGRAIDRIGAVPTLVLQGLAVCLVALPMTLLDYGFATACLLALVAGAALFNHIPPIQVRLMKLVPGSAGLLFSVNASFVYLGTAVGSSVSGTIVDRHGVAALGPASAAGITLALLYLAWLVRRERRKS